MGGRFTEKDAFVWRKTVWGCRDEDFKNKPLPDPGCFPGLSIAALRACLAFKESMIPAIFSFAVSRQAAVPAFYCPRL